MTTPFTVAVCGYKGGVGKTTVCAHLAEAAAQDRGSSILSAPEVVVAIDADPQQSLTDWKANSTQAWNVAELIALNSPAALSEWRRYLSATIVPTVAFIDLPPTEGLTHPISDMAMSIADLVLVPTSPSALEMRRIPDVLERAADFGVPVAVVLNRVRTGTRLAEQAPAALAALNVPVLEPLIPLATAVTANAGKPRVDWRWQALASELLSLRDLAVAHG